MRTKLILLIILSVFLFGCSFTKNEFYDQITFAGKSSNWEAKVKFDTTEKLLPINKEFYSHKMKTNDYILINFIGPKNTVVKSVQYSLSYSKGTSSYGGSVSFDQKPYTINEGTGGSESTSKISAEIAKNIKLGSYKLNFPEKNETLIMKINWDGNKETIKLKAQ